MRLAAAFLCFAVLVLPAVTRAQVGFEAPTAKKGAIRVDGSLGEWKGARFGSIGGGNNAAVEYSFAVDDGGLYVAADVRDNRLIRTSEFGTHEDAIVLTLVTPKAAKDVWLYAGVPGQVAGRGKVAPVGGNPEDGGGVKVVEGPSLDDGGHGYVLEAYVPWGAVGGGVKNGLRYSLRMHDVDTEAKREALDIAVAVVRKDSLDSLPELTVAGSTSSLLKDFIASARPDEERPRFDFTANVFGKTQDERVVVLDRYVLVFGDGYRDGNSYDVMRLPVDSPKDIEFANVAQLSPDGPMNIVVSYWQRDGQGSRRLWSALTATGAGLRPALVIETGKRVAAGSIENTVQVQRGKKSGEPMVVQQGATAKGLSAGTWHEGVATDAYGILLPWGPVSQRIFTGDGGRFAVVHEEENDAAVVPQVAETRPQAMPVAPPPAVPAGTPPTPEALIKVWKQRSGIPANAKPDFRVRANVAEDDRLENLEVYGSRLVVVGEGFRGGTAWFEFGIPVSKPDDVVDLSAHALTGNGRAQVVLQYKQHIQDVTRELVAVHCLQTDGFPRILAVEVARRRGTDSVTNRVSFSKKGSLEVLSVDPGKAKGWSAASWPFAPSPEPGIAPLLLPWSDKPARYAFDGQKLSAGR